MHDSATPSADASCCIALCFGTLPFQHNGASAPPLRAAGRL
jgi:hypothetical protein